MKRYQHLGIYSDWVAVAQRAGRLDAMAQPGRRTQQRLLNILGFSIPPEKPHAVKVERRWRKDGLAGEEISWSVGYGPRTRAWVLKPADARGPLPGVLALHDHGGFKFFGREKIADGARAPHPAVVAHRERCYGSRAFANALAHEGYVVLVPDTFLWGSRRFPLETITGQRVSSEQKITTRTIAGYNAAAGPHEHLVEKYCRLLGTTLAGVIAYEDRVAVNYLRSRADVRRGRVGSIGLSGGGLRTTLLQATCDHIGAAVIVGLMSTYQGLLDLNVLSHTWMLFPADWPRHGDWPDLAACRAPSPLLVQYDLDDELFTVPGMRAAHRKLLAHYRRAGHPGNYVGQFYPGLHKFDLEMQRAGFDWLNRQLRPGR